jgi:Mrp family chromosome partitioning ATPase
MESSLDQNWVPQTRPSVRVPAVLRTKDRSIRPAKKRSREDVDYIPIPPDVFARNRLVAAIQDSPHREAYNVLQASVIERMTKNEWVSLGITSPATGAGKTLTAVNLAIALARQASRRVLLLDLDLEHPSIHSCFEHEPSLGLEDCLFEGIALNDAAITPAIDGLMVLLAKSVNYNAMQILRSESLRDFLADIKKSDPDLLVIADLPAIDGANSVSTYHALMDCTLLVVEDTTTKAAHLRSALAMTGKTKLLGTVLNRTETTA